MINDAILILFGVPAIAVFSLLVIVIAIRTHNKNRAKKEGAGK